MIASVRTIALATACFVSGPLAAAEPETPATYLDRITRIDDSGPMLNAVVASISPEDAARAANEGKGPLAGHSILIKDNIETREWPTTAGSLALKDNRTGRDAPIVERLRKSGAIILGKTNLSEWANIRSSMSSSGWSAIGGQTKNPYATDRSPCGSSSGSGAAIAAGLSWAAIGTETDGSITCPASVNGIVGFKPTVGLVSRTYIVPISSSQDTAGPMAGNVYDAALVLNAIAGPEPKDPATSNAGNHLADFTQGLKSASLNGVRIGVLRKQVGSLPAVSALFAQALADMKSAGAVLVDIDFTPSPNIDRGELNVLLYELHEGMDVYLRTLPGNPAVRSLADVVRFNREHADAELRWFGQDLFEAALTTDDVDAYARARADSLHFASSEGIDALLENNRVAFLVAPTAGPAWPIDPVIGDHFVGIGAGSLAAVAGYPHLTVPMGAVEGLPVGMSFIGGKWDDADILKAGAAYERVRSARLAEPTFRPWGTVAQGGSSSGRDGELSSKEQLNAIAVGK